MNITKMNRSCVLLNGRAYVEENVTAMEMLELEEELKMLDSSYSTVFHPTALFKFYKDFGMSASVESLIWQMMQGNSCVVGVGNSTMKITRVSPHFCVSEWMNSQQQMHSYRRPRLEYNYEEQGHQVICN